MNTQKWISDLKRNSLSHGSLPFWSWNDRLEEQQLRDQIRNMHQMKMKGFFMHARFGLETEYMSDEWFRAVEVCIDEAKKWGMEAWCYDENGWPSGFGGGELLKDEANFARYLKFSVEKEYPEDALGVFCPEGDSYRAVSEQQQGCEEYLVVRVGQDESYVDILNPEVTRQFIECTYEVYKKRLAKEDFGKAMPGFFTDEPQYYRWATPWSNLLPALFIKKYGYDLMEHLPALFWDRGEYKKIRFDYHDLIARLYIDGFIKQVYEWCENNGCQVTGHSIEEGSLYGQIMAAGSVMPFYEYEHIPGIDWLGRPLKKDLMPKQLGSVCAQLGKEFALTESFALCGWDVSPKELKNIADFQYVNGVNLTCQHLYSYSYRGQRKRDYPAHYGPQNPWQEHLADFDEYYNNLGTILSRGEEVAPLLVIHPVHNAYMYFVRERDRGGEVLKALDHSFAQLSDFLAQHQLAYHYGDEAMMERLAKVEGNCLRVGKCLYSAVLIPEVETLDASTAALLQAFCRGGGALYRQGALPTRINAREADLSFLESARPMEELLQREDQGFFVDEKDHKELRLQRRQSEDGRFFFVTNVGTSSYEDLRIRVKDCKGLVQLDLLDLSLSPVWGERLADGSFEMLCHVKDSQSFVLMESEDLPPLPLKQAKALSREGFYPPRRGKIEKVSPNALTLDVVSYCLGEGEWVENVPLMQLKDELLRSRYQGKLTLRYPFTVKEIPATLRLAVEKAPYTSLKLNGCDLICDDKQPWLDPCFVTADVKPLVKPGLNQVECSFDYFQRDYVYYVLFGGVSESLRNCLNFDTEIEWMYLYGDFAVSTEGEKRPEERQAFSYFGDFAIEKSRDTVDLQNVVFDGFPFFGGSLQVSFVSSWHKGDPTTLLLDGRYAVCCVAVNGKEAQKQLFTRACELEGMLVEGENTIRLELVNSNRNLLGPLHHPLVEPLAVGPNSFTCEKEWKNGSCANYCKDRYCFMRFGVNTEE